MIPARGEMGFNLLYIMVSFPAIILALSLHEFGHAAMATKMGDPTPRQQGRLTLNPLAHLDPMGTIMIFATMFMGFGFGWGKPVQTNPAYYTNYRLGRVLVAIAGPAMNLAQAMLGLALMYLAYKSGTPAQGYPLRFLAVYVIINIVLMVFNLLPVPPLDGGHVLEMIIPWERREAFARFSQYGILILLALMWFGALGVIIRVFFRAFFSIVALGFGDGFVSFLLQCMG